jgi:hypothetical protein
MIHTIPQKVYSAFNIAIFKADENRFTVCALLLLLQLFISSHLTSGTLTGFFLGSHDYNFAGCPVEEIYPTADPGQKCRRINR